MTEIEQKKSNELQAPSLRRSISRYLAFVGMFVGAGFISGSIVHMGEGVNAWDVSVLVAGVIFFLASTCVQEFVFNKRNVKDAHVLQFLLHSIVLAIGVGMASGGIQHFVDTPTYSSYLVPIGLGLGVIAFFLKEKEIFTPKKWLQIISIVVGLTIISIFTLVRVGQMLPESLLHKHDHNSHEH
jgi:peptidoglycan/LPS O-acetylase OafA/YrhL